jgi:hypothetical protein
MKNDSAEVARKYFIVIDYIMNIFILIIRMLIFLCYLQLKSRIIFLKKIAFLFI